MIAILARPAIVLFLLVAATATACEITVRDGAFDAVRDAHWLCVMGHADDPETKQITDTLNTWLAGPASSLNLELQSVNADDPGIDWAAHGIPSAPPRLPVVVLIGRDYGSGRSFVIDHWEPGPTPADLETLATSPVREAIAQRLGGHVAVLLYAPGNSYGQDVAARSSEDVQLALQSVVEDWSQREPLGLDVVRLDRTDAKERTLCSFIGLPREGPDWVGVVFGQGKLMSPPLIGAQITAARLSELIEQLREDCNCSKPLPAMGVDIPLAWHEELEQSIQRMRSDDAAAEQLLAGLGSGPASLSMETSQTARGGPLWKAVLWTLGGLIALVVASSAGLVWWKRQQL